METTQQSIPTTLHENQGQTIITINEKDYVLLGLANGNLGNQYFLYHQVASGLYFWVCKGEDEEVTEFSKFEILDACLGTCFEWVDNQIIVAIVLALATSDLNYRLEVEYNEGEVILFDLY